MSTSNVINQDAVLLYLDGAHHALRAAQYNLEGSFNGAAISRAYYAFFYAATALLLTQDLTRSKHSGIMAAFREHFVKPGIFSAEDSEVYGKAFELRNVTDYEMMGKADEAQARAVLSDAEGFVKRCEAYLKTKRYL